MIAGVCMSVHQISQKDIDRCEENYAINLFSARSSDYQYELCKSRLRVT